MRKTYSIIIETPKGSRIKRNEKGGVDFISPFPCPFNYGRVEGKMGADGDPLDAIVLAEILPYNAHVQVPIIGVALFIDKGLEDNKYIFSARSPTQEEKDELNHFFSRYARIKNLLSLSFLRHCPTVFSGLEWKEIDLK